MKAKRILYGQEQKALFKPPQALQKLYVIKEANSAVPNCPIYTEVLNPLYNLRKTIIANELKVPDSVFFDIYDQAVQILQSDSIFLKYYTQWDETSMCEIFTKFTIINEYDAVEQVFPVFKDVQERIYVLRSFGLICAMLILNGFVLDRAENLVFINAQGLELVFL